MTDPAMMSDVALKSYIPVVIAELIVVTLKSDIPVVIAELIVVTTLSDS